MLEWSNVLLREKSIKKYSKSGYIDILKYVSGSAKKGEITAMMGLSGSGKTTLIKTLSGSVNQSAVTAGKVTMDDHHRSKNWLERIGFVNQDDIYYEKLTVRETLQNAYLFRCFLKNKNDSSLKKNNFSEKLFEVFRTKIANEKVNEIIDALKIQDCSETKMQKISGGERKRVMIGVEMISDPEILFLDEPTSGLDTYTALKIIKVLKNLAENFNKTIILTIHQPTSEIFNLFDRLILMNKGTTVFDGKATDVVQFLNNYGFHKRDGITVPEFIIEVCTDEYRRDQVNEHEIDPVLFKESSLDIDSSKIRTKNDFIAFFNFNIFQILRIAVRKFILLGRSKRSILKFSAIKMIPHLIIFCVILLFHFLIIRKIGTINEIKIHQVSPNPNYLVYMAIFFSYFAITVISFCQGFFASHPSILDEIKVVRKEISTDYYSTTGIYLGIYLFHLVANTFPLLFMCLFSLIFVPYIFSLSLIGIYILTSISSISFGLFWAGLSDSKIFYRISTVIVSYFIMTYGIFTLPQYDIFIQLSNLEIFYLWLVRFIFLILSLLPISHTFALCKIMTITYISYKQCGSLNAQELNQLVNETFSKSMIYIFDFEFSISKIIGLFFATNTLFIIIGILLLSRLIKPNLRLILEKKSQ